MDYFSLVLLFLCLHTVALNAADLNCCPPNQYVEEITTNTSYEYSCWDREVNDTTKVIEFGCSEYYYLSESDGVDLKIEDNRIILDFGGVQDSYETGQACIGDMLMGTEKNLSERVVVKCYFSFEPIIEEDIKSYFFLVSIIFYVFVAAIYLLLPEMRDIQGKSIISLCLCMAVALSVLFIIRTVIWSNVTLCHIRGFLLYFFLISGFLWMNSLSIQLLISFRRRTVVDYGWREFLWYVLYAYGVSATLTMIVAIVNYVPGNHRRPGIGLNSCWFFRNKDQWHYFYSVLTVLMLINIGIFIYISVSMCRRPAASNDVISLKYKFLMMLRLFIVMGVPWILDAISSVIESIIVRDLMDIILSMQGIIYFLVLVVFRKRTVKAMYRHGWLDCMSGPLEKYLAVGEDAEEHIVGHTVNYTVDNARARGLNGVTDKMARQC